MILTDIDPNPERSPRSDRLLDCGMTRATVCLDPGGSGLEPPAVIKWPSA